MFFSFIRALKREPMEVACACWRTTSSATAVIAGATGGGVGASNRVRRPSSGPFKHCPCSRFGLG